MGTTWAMITRMTATTPTGLNINALLQLKALLVLLPSLSASNFPSQFPRQYLLYKFGAAIVTLCFNLICAQPVADPGAQTIARNFFGQLGSHTYTLA